MSCNCKSEKTMDELLHDDNKPVQKVKISTYILKVLAFCILMVFLPIIMLVIVWFIFRTLVLNKDVDIKPLLVSLGQKFQTTDDEDDDEYDDLTENDVEMVDVEEITKRNK